MKKKRNLTKAELAAQASWEAMLKRHSKPLELGAKAKGIKVAAAAAPVTTTRDQRKTDFKQMCGSTAPRTNKVYTGTAMKGVGVMHKSNPVPVFDEQHAIDLAHMRR